MASTSVHLGMLQAIPLQLRLFTRNHRGRPREDGVIFPTATPGLLHSVNIHRRLSSVVERRARGLMFGQNRIRFLPV